MVEPQPSKLMMWVRSPSPAPALGSAHIAQSVEHFLGKEEVTGSIPVVGSRKKELKQLCSEGAKGFTSPASLKASPWQAQSKIREANRRARTEFNF